MKQRLIAIHLLNDRSGSPLILRQALQALQQDYDVTLFTATPSGDGFLNDMTGVTVYPVNYRWSKNRWITLVLFMWSQFMLLFRLMRFLKKTDVVYINTLLPFGAAIAGRIKGCRIIYHVHEVSLKPALFRRFLYSIANAVASKVLFVSNYVGREFPFLKPQTQVIYNALPESFTEAVANMERLNYTAPFTVLMLCSFKAYKGVYQFIHIAGRLPYCRFQLVLNTSQEEVNSFVKRNAIPENCEVFPAQQDTIPFYKQAHIVLNLSRPDSWIETFGMTVLEAMHCGRPVIVPTVGGVCELVKDGQEGFRIDSKNEDEIASQLSFLSSDFIAYKTMSEAAYERSLAFSSERFNTLIRKAFQPAYVGNKTVAYREADVVEIDEDYDALFQ